MIKSRNLIFVMVITFLYHTMNQMFVPTLPLYISQLGGNEVVVGVIVGLLSLGAVLGKVYFGKIATRYSNLLVLRIGLVVATIVLFLYLPFLGFAFLALVRLLQSIGLAGYVAGGQGLLAEFTKAHNRGLFFGIFAAMIGLGMTVGPLLGSYLAETHGYAVLFWGTALVVGLAAVLSFMIDGKGEGALAGMGKEYQPHSPWQNRPLMVVCGSMFFGATVMGATMSMLTLHARAVGLLNPSLFFVLFALMFTLGGALSGHLSDRYGQSALVIPGFIFLILGLLALAFLHLPGMMVVSGLLSGLGLGFINAVLIAMVPGLSINEVDAANDLAFFSNAFDLGVVMGSIGLSWIAARSFGLFWFAVALLTSFGLGLYIRYNPEKQKVAATKKAARA